jgi:hypothetical protein
MADFAAAFWSGTAMPSVSSNPALAGMWPEAGGASAATYLQRVFSSGVGDWCYFNGVEDETPAPGDTTPPWTGAITAYERLGQTS